jgi:hypothetical protein
MEKAGHDARRGYMDYVNALQGIVEAQSKTE